ncbi:MAG: right-handed parallel beta-helix repeat-containing protein [Planctomycetota bacterium]
MKRLTMRVWTTIGVGRAAACVCVGAIAGLMAAGPLNPPAGPVTSSYKTLTEVEPRIAVNAANTPGDADSLFKITLPGSYYLTGNITGVAGRHGVEIAARGVTLDLMGFALNGVPGSLCAVSGRLFSGENVAVSNGTIREWTEDGIDLGVCSNARVTNLMVDRAGFTGIRVGDGSLVSGCTVSECGFVGISINGSCTVLDCVSFANARIGIESINGGSSITNCVVNFNDQAGISVPDSTTISGCVVRANGEDGIAFDSDCLILNNLCTLNGFIASGAGIHALGTGNRIEGNSCHDADHGISVDLAGNIIVRNACSANTTNWLIAANNLYGPILDRTGPASMPVNGNFAPDAIGTTNPNANYSY